MGTNIKYYKSKRLLIVLLGIITSIIANTSIVYSQSNGIVLPNQSDWATIGVAITEGVEGDWDRYLWGAFANSIIEKDGVYYLYYQGSRYYDDTCDSVAERAIGVATSTDGINWTKYSGNPIITWRGQGSIEEGAVSSAILVENDIVYLYYGANTGNGCEVTGNGRLAISSDGLNFNDQGEVINALSSGLWGRGDEIFPLGAFKNNTQWNVFYTPNGVVQSRRLGVISGNSSTVLTSSSGVNSGTIPAWGTVSVIKDGSVGYAFVNDPGTNLPINVYSFNLSNPSTFTFQKSYTFSDCNRGSVLYENSLNKWTMLCRSSNASDSYLVKTVETTSPTATPVPTATPTPTASSSPTPVPVPGDANGDGEVDGLDYVVWLNHYGDSILGPANGDYDNSGIVDGVDYVIWLNNYSV